MDENKLNKLLVRADAEYKNELYSKIVNSSKSENSFFHSINQLFHKKYAAIPFALLVLILMPTFIYVGADRVLKVFEKCKTNLSCLRVEITTRSGDKLEFESSGIEVVDEDELINNLQLEKRVTDENSWYTSDESILQDGSDTWMVLQDDSLKVFFTDISNGFTIKKKFSNGEEYLFTRIFFVNNPTEEQVLAEAQIIKSRINGMNLIKDIYGLTKWPSGAIDSIEYMSVNLERGKPDLVYADFDIYYNENCFIVNDEPHFSGGDDVVFKAGEHCSNIVIVNRLTSEVYSADHQGRLTSESDELFEQKLESIVDYIPNLQ